jgi:N,N'-diacetylchitobiose phosphorylase
MDAMLNTWTLYQSEINVMFSRFASFIEVGGRTGLGYRDTAQDAMCVPHSNPEKCRNRIVELLKGLTSSGYGLHLFEPAWFEPQKAPAFKSPTVAPSPDKGQIIHGLKDVCADDALWLVPAVVEYIRESGDLGFANKILPYADSITVDNSSNTVNIDSNTVYNSSNTVNNSSHTTDKDSGITKPGSVYEHLKRILDFSAEQTGPHGICKGLRADWNDCLHLGGGESAMVSFLHHWALTHSSPWRGALAGRRTPPVTGKRRKKCGKSARTCSGTAAGIAGASPLRAAR